MLLAGTHSVLTRLFGWWVSHSREDCGLHCLWVRGWLHVPLILIPAPDPVLGNQASSDWTQSWWKYQSSHPSPPWTRRSAHEPCSLCPWNHIFELLKQWLKNIWIPLILRGKIWKAYWCVFASWIQELLSEKWFFSSSFCSWDCYVSSKCIPADPELFLGYHNQVTLSNAGIVRIKWAEVDWLWSSLRLAIETYTYISPLHDPGRSSGNVFTRSYL